MTQLYVGGVSTWCKNVRLGGLAYAEIFSMEKEYFGPTKHHTENPEVSSVMDITERFKICDRVMLMRLFRLIFHENADQIFSNLAMSSTGENFDNHHKCRKQPPITMDQSIAEPGLSGGGSPKWASRPHILCKQRAITQGSRR
jgi:hypothetical protein